jgi:hypothetical protein
VSRLRRLFRKYKDWPLWLKIAAPIVILTAIGGLTASLKSERSGRAGVATIAPSTSVADISLTTSTALLTTTTAGSPMAATSSSPAQTAVPTTAPPTSSTAGFTLIEDSGDVKIVLDVNLLTSGGCSIRYAVDGQALPDPTCTPGAAATRVTQVNIGSTICVSGYTNTVRPPSSITTPLKQRTAAAYGMVYDPTVQEYDHLIPLELGGANDVRNLWTEPPTSAVQRSTTNVKDAVESKLHADVCAGRIGLLDAQIRIATDWTTALVGL